MKLKCSPHISLLTSDGYYVCLIDINDIKNEIGLSSPQKNIYKIDGEKNIIWQINYNYLPNDYFTNLYCEENFFFAYNWNGGLYKLNIETGLAHPFSFMR